MRSVASADNVVPFRRPARFNQGGDFGQYQAQGRERANQRSLMDLVYATGVFLLAADDRDTKLIASRLQVYGFLTIEEVGTDGTLRRLRPSEAIRARPDRPWRLTKSSYGANLSVTIPSIDGFLFEPLGYDDTMPMGA